MPHQRALIAAQGFLELDMPDDALAELDLLPPGIRDSDEVLQLRLIILMRMKRWHDAAGVCARLRTELPESTVGYIHGAFCLHELGRTAEAKELLLSGPPALRDEACYYYNLGCYDAVLGNVTDAREHLRQSFAMDSRFRQIAREDPDLNDVGAEL